MRKMMLVASLMSAACGSVAMNDDEGTDVGSDIGSDAGTGSDDGTGSGSDMIEPGPPAISVQGSIRDERGDTIDFSTSEPIHTHAGETIDLAAEGCPSVYKYAYLMDATPTFGSATSPNDLAWKIRVTDAMLDGSPQFRVRSDAGESLVAWTELPAPDATGYSNVKLTRNGGSYPIASLGMRTGQFFIDVRATDADGLTTTSSICFDNHPLAAPLAISAFEKGSLFDITMADAAAITAMMQGSASVQVVKQRIVQQTAEPVTMTWSAAAASPSFTAKKVAGWVGEVTNGGSIICNAGNTNPWCVMATEPKYQKATETSSSGTLEWAKYSVAVRDDVSGEIIASSTTPSVTVTIPARTSSEAPHGYTFEVSLMNYSELYPEHGLSQWASTTTNTLMGRTYTGDAAAQLNYGCFRIQDSAFGPWCSDQITYWFYTAIDQATLTFSPFVATITAGPDAQSLTAPSYVPVSTLTSAAFTWDSGDDDLPGPF